MNTEQRYMLAVGLSFLVLMIFYPSLSPRKKPVAPVVKQEESKKAAESSVVQEVKAEIAKAETIELQNDVYDVKFSTLGATISELRFKKKWQDGATENIVLIKPMSDSGAFALNILGEASPTSQAIYKVENLDKEGGKITFLYENPGSIRIRKIFELVNEKSAINARVEIENLSKQTKELPISFSSQIYFGKEHGRYEQDQLEAFIVPQFSKIKIGKEGKIAKKPFVVTEAIEWTALTRHYFSVIVKPEQNATQAEVRSLGNRDGLEAAMHFAPESVSANGILKKSFLIHAGPEYYDDLKSFGIGFEETLTQGLWGFFRHWLFEGLRLCKRVSGNYGFAILLMTFFLKVLFSPFTHMSFESMRKMQAIQPKMKAIQTQFKNDPARMNKETMELYKRHKVNPMGGCLPMLIQIPVFISFYQVLAQFVELKGESLFWIQDLTQPDKLAKIPGIGFDLNILPLLMIGTMIWQQKVTPQQMTTSPEQAMMMQWMPVVFGFMFYQLPSGLVLYWTLNNLLTVSHQMIFHHRAQPIPED